MKPAIGEDLKELKKRLELLRQKRNGGKGPLPQEIWDDAVQIAQSEGISVTAQSLRLNHTDLKNRIELAKGGDTPSDPNVSNFQ